MITVDVKINGQTIVHIYGANIGAIIPGVCKYKYECYEVGETPGKGSSLKG